MKKPCCSIWEDMGNAVREREAENLYKTIEASKLPKFVFAPTFAFMNEMVNYCPACGTSFNEVAKETVKIEHAPPPTVPPSKPKLCRACGGVGFVDKSKTIKCTQCLGQGRFTSDHVGIPNGNFENNNKDTIRSAAKQVTSADDGFKEIGDMHVEE